MSFEMVIEIVCVAICALHAVIGWLHSLRLGRKVDALCLKCGQPLEDGVEHECQLDDSQLKKLVDFVQSIKGR